jgi:hypothetical protein
MFVYPSTPANMQVFEIGNLMLFLQSYFDESGKAADHNIASFCGFVATSDQWREFVHLWGRVTTLAEIQKPLKATEILKYRRALSPKIPVQTATQRIEALAPFVTAIRKSLGFGVAVAIDCRAFRNLPESDRAILKGEPHYWAFRMALLLIKQYAEHIYQFDPDIKVALCCDEEERYSVECLKLFINIRRTIPEMRERFTSIAFADDRYFPQLQAADIIASLARQEADRRFHNKPFDMKGMYDLLAEPNPAAMLAPVGFKFMDGDLLSGAARAEREGRSARKTKSRSPDRANRHFSSRASVATLLSQLAVGGFSATLPVS